MPNPNGRPRGPRKKRVMVTILETAYEWLEGKAATHGQRPAAYLARNIEQQATNATKNTGEPRFKKEGSK